MNSELRALIRLHLLEVSHGHPETPEDDVTGEAAPPELVQSPPAHDLVNTGGDEEVLVSQRAGGGRPVEDPSNSSPGLVSLSVPGGELLEL